MTSTNGQPACGTIAATATVVPRFCIDQEALKKTLECVFPLDDSRRHAIMSIVDNSQVKRRYVVQPIEYLVEPRPLDQISQEYAEHAGKLGAAVTTECLERAALRPADVDLFITVSCTGVMIPSLDAHLANELGFRSDVRRLPITELGCAAGASALARAADYVRAYPGATALVVAVELPSLTFQRRDLSQANLISSILFGDGAAAAVVTGRAGRGPRIIETESFLFPGSVDLMGFELKEGGFHIVLSREVPEVIRGRIRELVHRFLERAGLSSDEMAAFILHPGGQKLLHFIQQELGLSVSDTECSWHVLREYGNQSSASVLFVLHEWLARNRPPHGAHGLVVAFGPGFTADMLLLRWE